MTNCRLKKNVTFSKNWVNTLNSLKIQQKNYFSPQNGNLYAYAANNPVKYTDPTGEFAIALPLIIPAIVEATKDAALITGTIVLGIGVGELIKSYVNYRSYAKNKGKENGFIIVAHYTSEESAISIMESGFIEPSEWESNVFVMIEPSTSKEAEEAGAKYTDVKIMMKVPKNEVQKDIGTEQPKALMFNTPGPVNITNKDPIIVRNKDE